MKLAMSQSDVSKSQLVKASEFCKVEIQNKTVFFISDEEDFYQNLQAIGINLLLTKVME